MWLGDAAEIRRRAKRRQKNDRRDAELILDLLLRGEFPRLHCPPPESREVLWLLRYRHRLIRMRTQVKNSLRALALSTGSVKKTWLFGPRGRSELFGLPMTPAMSHQRDGWLELLADLSGRVVRLDEQIKQRRAATSGFSGCRRTPADSFVCFGGRDFDNLRAGHTRDTVGWPGPDPQTTRRSLQDGRGLTLCRLKIRPHPGSYAIRLRRARA